MKNYTKTTWLEDKLLSVLMMLRNGLIPFIAAFNDCKTLASIALLIRKV